MLTNGEWLVLFRLHRALCDVRQVLRWIADDAQEYLEHSRSESKWLPDWLERSIDKARECLETTEAETLLKDKLLGDILCPPGKPEERQDGKS